jgi:hypothetical protein
MEASAAPRMHENGDFLTAKLARTGDPHVAPLNALAHDVRGETGGEVPLFDPAGGGVHAKALFLLEAPGARATRTAGPRSRMKGSGITSPDNNDQTAENSWHLYREVGLDIGDVAIWNIVPWYVGSTRKIRAAGRDDIAAAQPFLHRLMRLLPEVQVVLTIGDKARDGWLRYLLRPDSVLLPTLACPHPSPQVLNVHPEYREYILAALRRVHAIVAAS